MWYKPAASLANPGEDIPISKQAYESFLDFEVRGHPLASQPISQNLPQPAD
jgi:hypothetical protein